MSNFVDNIRKGIKKDDYKRDLGLTTPENIVRFDDIAYGEDKFQVLDVYKPKALKLEKLPVIVSVHGGGWIYGSKETYQFYCMSLAQEGFAVVNFSYRLAPENKFPASLEDTCSVFKWVLKNCDKYGFDTENIFAVGDSAGGHILTLFTDLCVNNKYRKNYNFAPPCNFVPKAIALNCGAYQPNMSAGENKASTIYLMKELLKNKGIRQEFALINSVKHMVKGFPPTFLMTCEDDFLKNQFVPMIEKLMQINTPYVARYYVSKERNLQHVFHCDIKLPEAQKCNKDECDFFKQYIGINKKN